jgi:23S rRNA-/tRNA-specific pseudouridylate synthase
MPTISPSSLVAFHNFHVSQNCITFFILLEIFQVRKTYVALVCGHLGFPGGSDGEVDLPLVRDPLHPAFMRVATPKSQSDWALASKSTISTFPTKFTSPKESLTYYDVLAHEELSKRIISTNTTTASLPVTRVSLIPVTGR